MERRFCKINDASFAQKEDSQRRLFDPSKVFRLAFGQANRLGTMPVGWGCFQKVLNVNQR
jgi:hypothetical protein